MSTTTRLEELKRDLAQVENGQNRTRRSGGDSERGREADHPGEIPPKGWMDILWRAWGEVSEQNLFLIAGGVTYAILLALFPGLAALVSLYGLVFDASQIEKQVGALSGILPAQTQELLTHQLHQLVEASSGTLGIGAGRRTSAGALERLARDERADHRPQYRLRGKGAPRLLQTEHDRPRPHPRPHGRRQWSSSRSSPCCRRPCSSSISEPATKWLLLVVEWPLLIVLVMLGLAVLYRYAPDRDKPQWRWVSPGAIAATILWIVASIGFTVYVANFNSYDKTYGSLGGVVILLTWLYLSALAVLFGAVINAQSEKQTRKDFDGRFAARDGTTRCTGCRYTWRKQR